MTQTTGMDVVERAYDKPFRQLLHFPWLRHPREAILANMALDTLWAVHVGDPEDRPRIGTSVDDKHLNVSITFTDGSRREVEIARTP